MSTVTGKYRGTKEYFLVLSELITAARYGGTTTYQQIAEIMGLPLRGSHMGKQVGQVLGEISEDEHNYGRPLLSALAVDVKGKPGSGFFALARALDVFRDDEEKELAFWEDEKQKLYEEWKRDFKTA
jgi:hypothetical protein